MMSVLMSFRRVAIRAINRLLGWRDIRTAPHDGTWVLLAGGRCGFDDYAREIRAWPACAVGFYTSDDFDPYWAIAYWDGGWRTEYKHPTLWKPMPRVVIA